MHRASLNIPGTGSRRANQADQKTSYQHCWGECQDKNSNWPNNANFSQRILSSSIDCVTQASYEDLLHCIEEFDLSFDEEQELIELWEGSDKEKEDQLLPQERYKADIKKCSEDFEGLEKIMCINKVHVQNDNQNLEDCLDQAITDEDIDICL